ncbi:MAG: hypothetical protein A2Z47_00320 [Thermodesulfovibrio sp. RBG_19FT_COMBO_42_12]|nr:MAG: hypothetical protein A2Z47_00320 [Thermodesulfovibrio sp. RBG_19FT_COMBO_42_12]
MSSSQENIIRFPISSISNIFQQRRNCMWIIIIIIELCLGLAQVFTPYYVLPILLASILFMVMLINPEVSYYIMVISSVVLAPFAVNIYYSKYLTEQIYLPNLIIFLALISLMLSVSIRVRALHYSTPVTPPLLFLLFFGLISLLWTHDRVHGLYQLGRYINFYLLFLLSVSVIRSRDILRRCLWAWIWAGIVLSGGTILGRFLTIEPNMTSITSDIIMQIVFGDFESLRASSMATTAVTAAGLNICILIALGMYFIEEKQSTKRLLIFLILFMMTGLVLPRSRLGVFSLLIGLTFFYSRFPQYRKNLIKVSFTIFVVVFLIYFATAANRLEQALERWIGIVVSYAKKEATTLNRLEIWAIGFDKLIESYGIGTGIGGLKKYLNVPHAHNIYLSVLFDLGFIGLWILIWLITSLINTIRNSIKTCRNPSYRILLWAYGGGLIAVGIHGLTDFEYSFSAFLEFPLFIGLIMATVRLAPREGVSGEK